jgi:hypothetical protein
MTTQEFIETLRQNAGKELGFVFPNGSPLPAGYHFTEVKNIRVESVDCGATADQWTETVIQLWLPASATEGHAMSTTKALDILKKVDSLRPMDKQAPCRFEAENESGVTVVYDVSRAEANANSLSVALTTQRTQCKAQKRDASACGGTSETASSCCGSEKLDKAPACC